MRREREKLAERRSFYGMVMLVVLSIAAGRIAVVQGKEGTAFLSANDKSRWSTVAALVEDGTYVIDRFQRQSDPRMRNRFPWRTIDKVVHVGSDGKRHEYSSKPPLFPTMVAGVYWLVSLVTGTTLSEHPTYVARIILAVVNLPLLALFFAATIDAIDRMCDSEWTRRVAALAVGFATMVMPFAVTLNNHLPAVAATALALWCYVYAADRIEKTKDWKHNVVPNGIWFLGGLGAAMTAANELPALSMLVLWAWLYWSLDRSSVLPFLTAVVIVAGAFFGTNLIAHDSFRPPYAHRGNGPLIATLSTPSSTNPNVADQGDGSQLDRRVIDEVTSILNESARDLGLRSLENDQTIAVEPSLESGRWIVKVGERWFALVPQDGHWQLRHWDDWYEYPGTYWQSVGVNPDGSQQAIGRVGVDRGEPSRWVYLFHVTFGHHGIFSLTPLWLLLPIGFWRNTRHGPIVFKRLALAILVASVVCIGFYIARPLVDRNYGGVTCCLRWLLWFTPLWMVIVAPRIQRLSQRPRGRGIVLVLLATSIFSMSTALDHPWQHPWLYRFWGFWIGID